MTIDTPKPETDPVVIYVTRNDVEVFLSGRREWGFSMTECPKCKALTLLSSQAEHRARAHDTDPRRDWYEIDVLAQHLQPRDVVIHHSRCLEPIKSVQTGDARDDVVIWCGDDQRGVIFHVDERVDVLRRTIAY